MQHVPAVDGTDTRDVDHSRIVASFSERAKSGPIRQIVAYGADTVLGRKRVAVQKLIAAYRTLGTHWADLDPLKRQQRPDLPDLEPSFYGLTDADMDIVFNTSDTISARSP